MTETVGVEEVESRRGAWDEVGGALPVLGPADAPLVVIARPARGAS